MTWILNLLCFRRTIFPILCLEDTIQTIPVSVQYVIALAEFVAHISKDIKMIVEIAGQSDCECLGTGAEPFSELGNVRLFPQSHSSEHRTSERFRHQNVFKKQSSRMQRTNKSELPVRLDSRDLKRLKGQCRLRTSVRTLAQDGIDGIERHKQIATVGQLVSSQQEARTTQAISQAISQASFCFPVQELVLFIIAPGTVWKPNPRVLTNEGTDPNTIKLVFMSEPPAHHME